MSRILWNSAVNKAPLSAKSNRVIGGKAPSFYLKSIEQNHRMPSDRLDEILRTHQINPDRLDPTIRGVHSQSGRQVA